MNTLVKSNYGFPQSAIPTDTRRGNIRDMAILAALSKQPQINLKLDLLYSSYEHDGLSLDLYGAFYADDDCYDVQDIALSGTSVSLEKLLSSKQMNDISAWCDRNLPNAAEQLAELKANAIIDAYICRNESREI